MAWETFLPGSQIDVVPVRNTDALIGNRYEFKIIKISSERKNIILSRRELLEERLRDKKKRLMTTIEVGQKRKGRSSRTSPTLACSWTWTGWTACSTSRI